MHRHGASEPRQALEALGDETGQRIKRGDEDGDVLERRAREHLARDPVGRRLRLFLDSRVLLEVHGAVRPVASRPGRVGEERGALEEIGRQEVALVCVRSWGGRGVEGIGGILSEEEKNSLLKDFDSILDYIKSIENAEIDDATLEYDVRNVWREDIAEPREFSHELIVKQFPEQQDGYLKVKKIL